VSGSFSTEIIHRVYDDKTGDHIEVGPDHDTGDLLEIRQVDGGKLCARVVGYPKQMRALAISILALTEGEASDD
jgi:hypothetical protein